MEWGIHLPHLGRQASRQGLIRFAVRAEELGFHSGWVSDHIAWPRIIESKYPYSDDGSFAAAPDMPWLDPIGTLFFIAGCTERLKLGSTAQTTAP
jgi:alkanesulfonate monooxygenase SsuD/methylene tetrahydromethanopterin reductase-like flavin-dependent oxidoreductase (luciferase family)